MQTSGLFSHAFRQPCHLSKPTHSRILPKQKPNHIKATRAICFSEEHYKSHSDLQGVVSRIIPSSPPPAPQGRSRQGLLQLPWCPRLSPRHLPQPCTLSLVSGNAGAGRALPTSQILTLRSLPSQPRNNIFREPSICGASPFNRGSWILALVFFYDVATPQVDLSKPDPASGTRNL